MDETNFSTLEQMKNLSSIASNQNNIFDEGFNRLTISNDLRFRNNYSENSKVWHAINYEKCTVDFVPIVNEEYLMIDKESHQICGTYIAKPFEENVKAERTITSILFADQWDIREMMPIIRQKKWNYIYFVMNEATSKFGSYFKVKEFLSTLPANVKFFVNTDEMRQYFLEDHDAYLPRKIVAPEPEKYEILFHDIHEDRIHCGIPSRNVFLSICIPTYNRGELARRAVQVALTSEFDAEIEVLVCDNGSNLETEAYDEIADMKDSRLRYYRSLKNRGYMHNILKCTENALGYFAIYFSDEDTIIPENIKVAMEWLIVHKSIGACSFNGEGRADYDEKTYDSGVDACMRSCNMSYTSYITGTCINLNYIRTLDVIKKTAKYVKNRFYELYTHNALALILSLSYKICDSGIQLWRLEKPSGVHDWGGQRISNFNLPEDRMRQERGIMEIVSENLSSVELGDLLINRIHNTFYMLSDACLNYGREYVDAYPWDKIWIDHYQNYLQIMRDLDGKIEITPAFEKKIEKTFFYWAICKREQRLHEPEENLLPALQAQVVKYYYDKGTPIEKIDFESIKNKLSPWVQNFLEKKS